MGLFGASRLKTLLTSLILSSVVVGSASDGEVEKLPICGTALEDLAPSKNLLFISTLDGQVTALDARDGSEKWHLQAGTPLLSSSIHRLELSNGGQWVRLVPSLGGSLYKFSGDSLEPLPLTADQLLSSSHKYSDDIIIAGGKETSTMGVSTGSGELAYSCSLAGCVNTTGASSGHSTYSGEKLQRDSGELVLIRRVTQTVRAIEPRTGQERWNFSVGQHQLSLQPFKSCSVPTPHLSPELDLVFKVVVPEGIICAVEKNAPHNVVWQQKLETPIVGAWIADGNELHSIDLFGAAFVPSWSPNSLPNPVHNPHGGSPNFPPLVNPAVYIGMHDRQLYIQESVRMQALVQSQATLWPALGSAHEHPPSLILPWKPVPARLGGVGGGGGGWDEEGRGDQHNTETALLLHEKEYATTAISVLYASEYVNGNGYYLYTDGDRRRMDDPTCDRPNSTSLANTEEEEEDPGNSSYSHEEEFDWADDEPIHIFVVSLWFWWKEVAAIVLSTALCLNFLTQKFRRKFTPPEVHRHYVLVERTVQIVPQPPGLVEPPEPSPPPFCSRYLSDFTPVHCLGRGGFGIVFEAKNKIDDCSYAVKRITLPNKKDKRERVLREVRALAKLEHSHIVRYFNAWIEEPPLGWQDPFESDLKSGMDFTDTYSKLPTMAKTANNKSLLSNFKDRNVCLSIPPDMSESCDNKLSGDFNRSRIKSVDFNRQRSYSMNDSFSIVFEKSFRDRSNSSMDQSVSQGDDLNESFTHKEEDDDDSFVVFAEPESKISQTKSGDSVISISDTDFKIYSADHNASQHPAALNETQIVCIDESPEHKKSKKGHRRNLSLDLKSSQAITPRQEFVGKMYLYIQMQLCQQKSLRDWLRENTCLEDRKSQVVTIFEQIVQAVEYVHLQGLIHRDLKPSNIFFAVDGRIKVGDFGLVTARADPLAPPGHPLPPLSPALGLPEAHDKHTQQVGTHLYMSPEQLRGEAHGYKVDIWSLGLVLAELLIPFNTEMERVTSLKAFRDHKFPQDFIRNHPQEHSLLLLMLSAEPLKRPSTLGVRARAPLLHHTDPRFHFSLPPHHSHHSSHSSSSN